MPRAILQVTDEFIVDMCIYNPKPRYYNVIENALPNDAKAVGVYHDDVKNWWGIVVESDLLPEVPEGQPLPFLDCPVFQTVWMDDLLQKMLEEKSDG